MLKSLPNNIYYFLGDPIAARFRFKLFSMLNALSMQGHAMMKEHDALNLFTVICFGVTSHTC